jgi:hypothetical protein
VQVSQPSGAVKPRKRLIRNSENDRFASAAEPHHDGLLDR